MLVIRESQIHYKEQKYLDQIKMIKAFLRQTETLYGIPYKALHFVNKESGRCARKWRGINLSNIKMAIIFVILESEKIHDGVFATAFGMDRTSVLNLRAVGRDLFDVDDEMFFHHYNKIRQVWISRDEKSLQLCKQIVSSLSNEEITPHNTIPTEHRGIFEGSVM
jgi:hypothetical protein